MNSEFENKLKELKNELEAQRLLQVGTMKNVLERQHSNELVDLEDVHQQEMDGLRDGKISKSCSLSVNYFSGNIEFRSNLSSY